MHDLCCAIVEGLLFDPIARIGVDGCLMVVEVTSAVCGPAQLHQIEPGAFEYDTADYERHDTQRNHAISDALGANSLEKPA